MKGIDLFFLALIALGVFFAVRSIHRRHKNGGCCGCSGCNGCNGCNGCCSGCETKGRNQKGDAGRI